MSRAARPILKWAGGKTRLAAEIAARLPERIDTYYEPFVGGAAVYFRLAQEGRFRRAVLGDKNRDLVDLYRAVRDDVEKVIRRLQEHRKRHCEDEYYRVRALVPGRLDLVERAARLIYLNKTGYNGLFRVNRAGQFNVPFGRYKNPNICDAENLRAAARALVGVRLIVADFARVCARVKPGDAVYFDPPYDPVSKTAHFTAYHKEPFDRAAQERLANLFHEFGARGIATVLSNSDTPLTRRLYRPRRDERFLVSRPINSRGTARGAVSELLVSRPRPVRGRRAS